MTPLILLLCIVLGSILITRIGAIALEITGLSKQSSVFQARSAYTNCGFTTNEAEKVVNHPVRRHIVMFLMLMGHLGVASVAGTVLVTVLKFDNENWWMILGEIAVGAAIILYLALSRWITRATEYVIRWALVKFTKLETLDYHGLMHLNAGYVISEITVKPEDWLANQSLRDLLLSKEGVLVLGIERPGSTYIGTPEGYHVIKPEDTLIVYGHEDKLKNLDERRRGYFGDRQHQEAVVNKLQEEQKVNEELAGSD